MRKTIRLLLFIFISFLLVNISCKKEKEPQEGDIEVVINESTPQNPYLSLKFEEDLSITKEGWFPVDVAVDDEENLYVFGEYEMFIYKFDVQGKEIFKKVFSKGQGPGEFAFMDPYFSADRKLYLYDKLKHRLTIFDQDFKVQDIMKFHESRYHLRLDSKGNMFFWVSKYVPGTKDTRKRILTKFSPSGRLLDEIFEYINPPAVYDKSKNKFIHELYSHSGIYKLDSDDYIYYSMSDRYEINVVSPQGKLVKKITKRCQSRKLTKKDIEKVARPSSRREYIIPEHMPYMADFFVLDNKYLLVITFENDYDAETLAGDLFDEDGSFQTRIAVPKYWSWYGLFNALKNQALYKNNHFYTIETDENEENFYVKRYKMIWEDK